LIRKAWGDALGMTLVVARCATEDEALAQNDRAAEILSRAAGVPGVYSLASVCPSRADQMAVRFLTFERQQTPRTAYPAAWRP